MFTKARIKLTTWYLLIIMTISLSFSVFIYKIVSSELQRRLSAIETRLNLQRRGMGSNQSPGELYVLIDDLQEAKEKIFYILLNTNITIFIVSAFGGYFLAGKTLSPIENAMEEQKRFVSDAGHELKTPLTSMQTALEVALRDKKLTLKDAKKELRESLFDIKKLTILTNNLLMLSRIQNNSSSINKRKTDIKKTIYSIANKMKPLANEKHIKISLKLKPIYANVDDESFESLLRILLDNAVKYTPKGGRIKIETFKKVKIFEVKITDTGVGISKKDLPHVFDRFYRVDQSRSKVDSDGYGLGLAIAKKIVDNHNGSISVKSILGKGSVFKVKLPRS